MLSPPLRERFGAVYRLDFYDEDAIEIILGRSARLLGLEADQDGLEEIAKRARGTPRVANRLLKRVRDYAEVKAQGAITKEVALEALERIDVDSIGLDEVDHKILRTIVEKFGGGPTMPRADLNNPACGS
jgi:Holliday junction DNA helicase RuvB